MDDGNERIVVCTLNLPQSKPTCLINAYMPSGRSASISAEYKKNLDILQAICNKYSTSHEIIIASDLNHDLFGRRDPHRQQILNLLRAENLTVCSSGYPPTYNSKCDRFSSHLDVFIASPSLPIKGLCADVITEASNTSPHSAVVLTLSATLPRVKSNNSNPQTASFPRPKWDQINKEEYKKRVEENLREVDLSLVSLESAARLTENAMVHASKSMVPPRKHAAIRKRPKAWTASIADAVRKSKIAFARYKELDRPKKPHPSFLAMRRASRAVRAAHRVRAACGRKKLYTRINQASVKDQKTFHKLIRRQRTAHRPQIIIKDQGQDIHDPVQAAGVMRDHFATLATPQSHPAFDDEHLSLAENDLDIIAPVLHAASTGAPPVSEDQVFDAIRSLNKNKAADSAGLTAEHLQYAADEVSPAIASLLTRCNIENTIPPSMKSGRKLPIPKKNKDPTDPNNTRGISITSQLGKVQEAVIRGKGCIPMDQHPSQFGFTAGMAPQMAALCVTEALAEAKAAKKPLYMVSIDAQKAFDVVSHPLMVRKLLTDGTPRDIVASIVNLYKDCTEAVLWNGTLSEPYKIKQGVRQGGLLSTDLYKAYINDLLKKLSLHQGVTIGVASVSSPTCADDVILMATCRSTLQTMVDEIALFSKRNRYSIHPSKSVALAWKDSPPDVSLNGKHLPTTDTLEHLGVVRVITESKIQTRPFVESRVQLMRRTAYSLMAVGLHGQDGLNPMASLKIINTYVSPRMLYGLESILITKTEEDILSRAHRALLRDIQSLPVNTATEMVYLLPGALTLQAQLDMRRLSLAGAVARLDDENPLKVIAMRQLSLQDDNGHSWFAKARQTATRYQINLDLYMAEPWNKEAWKREIHNKIVCQTQQMLLNGARGKSSTRMVNLSSLNQQKPSPHPLWKYAGTDPRKMTMAAYRAKMLTGAYILQARLAKTNQYDVDPTCPLCHQEDENMPHFIWSCQELMPAREKLLPQISEVLTQMKCRLPRTPDEWCRCILNGLPPASGGSNEHSITSFNLKCKCKHCTKSNRRNSLVTDSVVAVEGTYAVVTTNCVYKLLVRLNHLCNKMCFNLHQCRTVKLKKLARPGAPVKRGKLPSRR